MHVLLPCMYMSFLLFTSLGAGQGLQLTIHKLPHLTQERSARHTSQQQNTSHQDAGGKLRHEQRPTTPPHTTQPMGSFILQHPSPTQPKGLPHTTPGFTTPPRASTTTNTLHHNPTTSPTHSRLLYNTLGSPTPSQGSITPPQASPHHSRLHHTIPDLHHSPVTAMYHFKEPTESRKEFWYVFQRLSSTTAPQ